MREFDKFVVVVTKCQTAIDSIQPSLSALAYRVMLLTCEYMSSAALITFEFDS